MSSAITLEWELDHSILYHNIPLNSPTLLVSSNFLQGLLPPDYLLLGVKAILEDNNYVDINRLQHIDGNIHYLLDSSLSTKYSLSITPIFVCDSPESSKSHKSADDSAYKQGGQQLEESVHDLSSSSTGDCLKTSFGEGTSNVAEKSEHHCQEIQSVVNYISEYGPPCILKAKLAKITSRTFVKEIPRIYNDDNIFEFPATFGEIGQMHGMEQKYDGHIWTRPITSNMALQCTVRVSYCIGALECHRNTCPYYINNKKYNTTFFKGHLSKKIAIGLLATDEKTKITCHYCKRPAYCVETCRCMVYYVMPHDSTMTRMMLHLGSHQHAVQPGTSKIMIDKTKQLVSKMLKADRSAGPRKIQMGVAKEMIFSTIVEENTEDNASMVGEVELSNFLEELVPLVESQR